LTERRNSACYYAMHLWLIRHGQTDKNVQDVMHIVNDPTPLSSLGAHQALQTARFLKQKAMPVEAIFCSLEKRAEQTAQILQTVLNVPIFATQSLTERDWGRWNNESWNYVRKQLEPLTVEERYQFIPPQGESWRMFEQRLEQELQRILRQPYQRVAIVTHGGCLRCLMPWLTSQPKESSFEYDFANCSLTEVEYQAPTFRVLGVNQINHLRI
jgi:broad specificity phosphatase PhoE